MAFCHVNLRIQQDAIFAYKLLWKFDPRNVEVRLLVLPKLKSFQISVILSKIDCKT